MNQNTHLQTSYLKEANNILQKHLLSSDGGRVAFRELLNIALSHLDTSWGFLATKDYPINGHGWQLASTTDKIVEEDLVLLQPLLEEAETLKNTNKISPIKETPFNWQTLQDVFPELHSYCIAPITSPIDGTTIGVWVSLHSETLQEEQLQALMTIFDATASILASQLRALAWKKEEPTSTAHYEEQELIQRLQLYRSELEVQNEELKVQQEELTVSNERMNSLFEQAPIPYFVLNDEAKIESCNEKGLAFLEEKDLPEFLQLSFKNIISKDDRPRFEEAFLEVISGRKTNKTLNIRFKRDTNTSYAIAELQLFINKKKELQCLLALSDITALKTTEIQLQLSERKLKEALRAEINLNLQVGVSKRELSQQLNENERLTEVLKKSEALLVEAGNVAGLGGWEVNLADLKPQWTDETFRIHGMTPAKEISIEDSLNCYVGEGREIIQKAVKKLIEIGKTYDLELLIKDVKGKIKWIRTIGKRELKEGKPHRIFGTFQDITLQKEQKLKIAKLNDELRFSKKLLDEAGRIAQVGGWELRLPSNELLWTDETYLIHGMEPQSPVSAQDSINCYTGNSKQQISDAVDQLLALGEEFDLELTFRDLKGNNKWVRVKGKRELINGSPYRIYGTFQDITKQKEAQQKLYEYKQIFDLSISPICIADFNGYFKEINPAWVRLLGYTEEEIKANPFVEFVHPDDRDSTIQEYEEQKRNKQTTLNFHNRYRTKNGNYRWLQWFSLVNYELELIYCSVHDITEIKATQDLLATNEKRYRMLVESAPYCIVLHDREGYIVYANPLAIRTLKAKSEKDLLRKHISQFIHPDSLEEVKQRMSILLSGKEKVDLNEERFVCLNGTILEVEVAGNLTHFQGEQAIQVVFRNISERRKQQLLLQENSIKLSVGHQLAKSGSFELDLKSQELILSEEHLKVMGIGATKKLTYLLSEFAENFIVPEDHRHIQERYQYALNNNHKDYVDTFEYRLIHQDGSIRNLIVRSVFYDHNKIMGVTQDITVRKKALIEVERSKSFLNAFLASANDGIWVVNNELKLIYFNEMFLKRYESTFGNTINLGEYVNKDFPAQLAKSYDEHYEKALKGNSFTTEYAKGDSQFELTYNPVYQNEKIIGVSGIGRDITEKKRQEEELRKLALISQTTENGVILTDVEGRIEWVNEAFLKISGYTFDECVGQKPGNLVQGKGTDPTTVQVLSEALRKKEIIRREILNFSKTGIPYWIDLHIQPVFDSKGEVVKYFSTQKDITEAKAKEKALEKQNEELKKVNHELDNFVYRVSHDLRAPVSSSLGLLEIIKATALSEDTESYLSLQEQSLKKMDRFIQDILNFSRNSRLGVALESVDLALLVSEIVTQYSFTEGGKAVTTHIEIPDNVLVTDKMRLRIILNNLISNAYQYYNAYAKEPPYLRVKAMFQDQTTIITVSDNGMGIMKEHLPLIFEMFHRASDHNVGSGLGLYIVREMVNKLKGTIEVISTVNKGTIFTLSLPTLKEERATLDD